MSSSFVYSNEDSHYDETPDKSMGEDEHRNRDSNTSLTNQNSDGLVRMGTDKLPVVFSNHEHANVSSVNAEEEPATSAEKQSLIEYIKEVIK